MKKSNLIHIFCMGLIILFLILDFYNFAEHLAIDKDIFRIAASITSLSLVVYFAFNKPDDKEKVENQKYD